MESVRNGRADGLNDLTLGIGQSVVTRSAEVFFCFFFPAGHGWEKAPPERGNWISLCREETEIFSHRNLITHERMEHVTHQLISHNLSEAR